MTTIPQGICVLADGGCYNNNKPVTERHMYGSIAVFNGGKQVESTCVGHRAASHRFEYGLQGGHASNNLAELMALDEALTYADALTERTGKDLRITILTDSEWAMNVMQGNYKIKAGTNEMVKLYADKVKGRFLHTRYNVQHVGNQWVKSVLGH